MSTDDAEDYIITRTIADVHGRRGGFIFTRTVTDVPSLTQRTMGWVCLRSENVGPYISKPLPCCEHDIYGVDGKQQAPFGACKAIVGTHQQPDEQGEGYHPYAVGGKCGTDACDG